MICVNRRYWCFAARMRAPSSRSPITRPGIRIATRTSVGAKRICSFAGNGRVPGARLALSNVRPTLTPEREPCQDPSLDEGAQRRKLPSTVTRDASPLRNRL